MGMERILVQHRVDFWPCALSLLILIATTTGCQHEARDSDSQSVLLYKFANTEFNVTVPLPHVCTTPTDMRRATAYELYAQGLDQEAAEDFGRLVGTEHDLDARLMLAILHTKGKDFSTADSMLSKIVATGEHYAAWPYPSTSWPRMARVWCLCEWAEDSGGLPMLDTAVEEANANREINGDPIAAKVSVEARKKKSHMEAKRAAVLFLCVGLIVLFVLIPVALIVWIKWPRQYFVLKKIANECKRATDGELVRAEETEAALAVKLLMQRAEYKATALLRNKIREGHLVSHKNSLDVTPEIATVYETALSELDALNLPVEQKEQCYVKLEERLRDILSTLVVNA